MSRNRDFRIVLEIPHIRNVRYTNPRTTGRGRIHVDYMETLWLSLRLMYIGNAQYIRCTQCRRIPYSNAVTVPSYKVVWDARYTNTKTRLVLIKVARRRYFAPLIYYGLLFGLLVILQTACHFALLVQCIMCRGKSYTFEKNASSVLFFFFRRPERERPRSPECEKYTECEN